MATQPIKIPSDLLLLKSSDALERVSLSQWAHEDPSALRRIFEAGQAAILNIQGEDAVVAISTAQYDEMVGLIHNIQEAQSDDGFLDLLSRRFDELTAKMNRPGAAQDIDDILFGDDPTIFNDHYRPGATETEPKK